MRLFLVVAALMMPPVLDAQFSTPVPKALSREAVRREELVDLFARHLRSQLERDPDPSKKRLFDQDSLPANRVNLAAAVTAFCADRPAEPQEPKCDGNILANINPALLGRHTLRPGITRELLPLDFPLMHSRAEIADYLRQAGDSVASVFSQFAANVSDKEAFVSTSVISGLAGRLMLAVNYAAVVVKSDDSDATVRETVENQTANVLRMVNNGGTLTMRLQAPLHASSGASNSFASSMYTTVGLVGTPADRDSLSLSANLVGESMLRISVRDPSAASTLLGDILFGARIGVAYAQRGLVADGKKTMFFGQLAVGLLQNNKMSLSALVSVLDKKHKAYMPRLMVNLSAIR